MLEKVIKYIVGEIRGKQMNNNIDNHQRKIEQYLNAIEPYLKIRVNIYSTLSTIKYIQQGDNWLCETILPSDAKRTLQQIDEVIEYIHKQIFKGDNDNDDNL